MKEEISIKTIELNISKQNVESLEDKNFNIESECAKVKNNEIVKNDVGTITRIK